MSFVVATLAEGEDDIGRLGASSNAILQAVDELNAAPRQHARMPAGVRVMVVSADPLIIADAQPVLERMGVEVAVATDATRALSLLCHDAAAQRVPAVVLLDDWLDGVTVGDLALLCRSDPLLRVVAPVLVGEGGPRDGIVHALARPVRPPELLELLGTIVGTVETQPSP